jgi:TonB-dependent receptor
MSQRKTQSLHAQTAVAAACSLTCLLLGSPAMAQTVQPPVAAASAPVARPGANAPTVIVVTGFRQAQLQAIDLKRNADTVVDSIVADDLGKLPDATVTDSLQRISGVQIRREAGEGTSLNIRGFGQVGTLLNGESFLSAGSITTVQPNYSDIPSQLLGGADVYKSATASLLGGGISGTVNLKTLRPMDMKQGFTTSLAAEYGKGSESKDPTKSVNGVFAWRSGRTGAMVTLAHTDSHSYYGYEGLGIAGFNGDRGIARENNADPSQWDFERGYGNDTVVNGVVGQRNVVGNIVRDSTGRITGFDANRDGDINDAYFRPGAFLINRRDFQRKRTGLNLAFQTEFANDFRLTAEAFLTKQDQFSRRGGFSINTTSWSAAQFKPLASTSKLVLPAGYQGDFRDIGGLTFNTVQKYQLAVPNLDSYSENNIRKSDSSNLNLELDWNNGGPLTLRGRVIHGKAKSKLDNSYAQFSLSNGSQWFNGIGSYPTGQLPFNTGGYVPSTEPATIDFSGVRPTLTLSPGIQALLSNPANYALKTISSENNEHSKSSQNVLRLDGTYELGTQGSIDFGTRISQRSAETDYFDRLAPLYAGRGASNPAGCLVKWKAFDVQLNATGAAGGNRPVADCNTLGAPGGPYTAGLTRKLNDPTLLGQFQLTSLPGAPPALTLNPTAMDNPAEFNERLYPGHVNASNPGRTYKIDFDQNTFYVQGNRKGQLFGMPWTGNAGVRHIQTEMTVYQNIVGASRPYGAPAFDIGDKVTKVKYSDTLPAFNFAIEPLQNFRVRAAYAKNMMALNLLDWAGGLQLNYGLNNTGPTPYFAVLSGRQDGNPSLEPWRSTNTDLSFEWYNRPGGVVSLGFYNIKIEKELGSATVFRADLPDLDGVVRAGANIESLVQKNGNTLSGFEVAIKQRLDFLPGFLSGFGIDASYTRSNTKFSGVDLAGVPIPIGESPSQSSAALWYERAGFQARVAATSRGKRLAATDVAGVGLSMYQEATTYVDASVSYEVAKGISVYLQGSNLTNEFEKYYIGWADQRAENNLSERKFLIGIRAKF